MEEFITNNMAIGLFISTVALGYGIVWLIDECSRWLSIWDERK